LSAYCTIADVYTWIPRGSIAIPARLVSASASTDALTIDSHGLETGDVVTFRVGSGGTIPTGLVAGTTYYVIKLSDSSLSVSLTDGGAAVDITAAGANTLIVVAIPWTSWIAQSSAELESTMPAHAVPLDSPYPAIVTAYTAGIVAEKALSWAGVGSPPSFSERMDRVRAELKEWRKNGIPIRGAIVPTSSNRAVSGGAIAADARGWAGRGNAVIP